MTKAMLVIVLQRAHRAIGAFFVDGLVENGVSMDDFAVLEALLHKGPLTASALASKIDLSPAQIRRAVDRLERRGSLARSRSFAGEEVSGLTKRGRAVALEIYETHAKDIEAVMESLTAEACRELGGALKAIGLRAARLQEARVRSRKGGLASWQLRVATDHLRAHLGERVLIRDLASQVELSPSRFGRAFKRSLGVSPHRWQLNQRIAEAQGLLRDRGRSQVEVALATGFAEQSHFSRVFKRIVGVTPGAWRRR